MNERIINTVAAVITIFQTLGSLFVNQDYIFQKILIPNFLQSEISNFLVFLMLELSLGWTFGWVLVLLYLRIQSQAKVIYLLIPAVISAWVSFFNVKYILFLLEQPTISLSFIIAYFFSFIIAILLIGDHAVRYEKHESSEIRLSLAFIQFTCFAGVFFILSPSLKSNIYFSLL